MQSNIRVSNLAYLRVLFPILLCWTGFTFASSGGITGYSGKNGTSCSNCHSGSIYGSSLSYQGATQVAPGQQIDITFLLQVTNPASNAPYAGINIATSNNGGSLEAGSGMRASGGELSHSSPQALSDNQLSWSFSWTAPDTSGEATIYACSETVDRNSSFTGDDASPACISQVFEIVDSSQPSDSQTSPVIADVDNDGRSDYAVWRPTTQTYYTKSSESNQVVHREVVGIAQSDIPLIGDINGNGIADLATWSPQSGIWSIIYDDGSAGSFNLGQSGDIPFLADRDGDGKVDPIVRRPTTGSWLYLASESGYAEQQFTFGSQETDVPIIGDFDQDNLADFAIWRDGVWYMRWSSDNETRTQSLGTQTTDIMTPADFDGDGMTDVAMWRPTTGTWYIYYSSGNYPDGGSRYERRFGTQSTDLPIPADYDGDGKADLAIRRPDSFEFIYLSSATGDIVRSTFGKQAADIPVVAPWQVKSQLVNDSASDTDTETDSDSSGVTGDIDSDRRADLSVWRPSNRTFYTKSTATDQVVHRQVLGTDTKSIPLLGDVDGNGVEDLVVWDNNGLWHVSYDNGEQEQFELGQAGDIPLLADRDGDGKDDIMVRRPSEGRWYYLASNSNYSSKQFDFGRNDTDVPVLGHYDNDDRVDFAIWRDGTWYMRWSSDNQTRTQNLGTQSADIMTPADFDGDGITDVSMWRPSTGTWYIYYSSGHYPDGGNRYERSFGSQETDIPVPADYDGDGKADLAIRRPNTGEFVYLSSQSGEIITTSFGRNAEDIPALAPWQAKQSLLVSDSDTVPPEPEPTPEPTPDPDPTPNPTPSPTIDPAQFFAENISQQVVQSRCINCHVAGGTADGLTELIFVPSSVSGYQDTNRQTLQTFIEANGIDYVLTKASGGLGHVGGPQLPIGSDVYNDFATYLNLAIGNGTPTNSGLEGFWEGVTLLDSEMTYRRASFMLTGQIPTLQAMQTMQSASEQELETAIINLMQGDGFHEFLLRGANDRLLTDKYIDAFAEALDVNSGFFPGAVEVNYQLQQQRDEEDNPAWRWFEHYKFGFTRAPLELIAYVVENDRPYTEILTADYMMLNPYTNAGYRGNANFDNEEDVYEFKPGQIEGFMLWTEGTDFRWDDEVQAGYFLQEGENITWPHSGILNDLAWLNRYPSTATNRNRARSRWTYYHFLDFDVEKSAQRTQDPDALADTNNPTMNNVNCTVCHERLDPIAGAYQDYGDWGWYRDQWGGMDSLAPSYKWPENGEDSLYQEGDTWYRDMRAPGFESTLAPVGQDSMRWLGTQVANSPDFARATVKFWWHTIIGQEPLYAPTDSSDTNYSAHQEAYIAQSTFIQEVSESFAQHWNLKRMLAEITISPWFRASANNENASAAQQLARMGTEKLLTPEELDNKTRSLTGIVWNEYVEEWRYNRVRTALTQNFNIMYGGIDSFNVTNRAREMTSMMSQVALAHAAEMSCPILMTELTTPDQERKFLSGIDKSLVPGVVQNDDFSVEGLAYFTVEERDWGEEHVWYSNSQEYQQDYVVDAGNFELLLSYANPTYHRGDENHHHRALIIDHLSVYGADGSVILSSNGADLDIVSGTGIDGHCTHPTHNPEEDRGPIATDRHFNDNCPVTIPITFESAETITVVVEAYYREWNNNGNVAPEDSVGPATLNVKLMTEDKVYSQSESTDRLRAKLVELHKQFLGENLSAVDSEITRTLQLFTQTMEDRSTRSTNTWFDEWNDDFWTSCGNFDFEPIDEDTRDEIYRDNFGTLTAWRTVLAYLMSDPKYLHE